MDKKAIIKALRDFGQSASNTAADTVAVPVDLIAAGLRSGGLPIPSNPVGGSEWMRQKGLTVPVGPGMAKTAGEAAGILMPMVGAAKAPQIAAGLNQMGANAAKAGMTNKGQRGAVLFHGTNAEIPDKGVFDLSRVGSGTGAKTEGWGGYFSESAENAKRFGPNLYKTEIDDEIASKMLLPRGAIDSSSDDMVDSLKMIFRAGESDGYKLANSAMKWRDANTKGSYLASANKKVSDSILKALRQVDGKPFVTRDELRESIRASGADPAKISAVEASLLADNWQKKNGLAAYRDAVAMLGGSQKETSNYFSQLGIGGLRYPSSADLLVVDPSATNYVVWDQSILNKMPFTKIK